MSGIHFPSKDSLENNAHKKLLTIPDLQELTSESQSCWRKRLARREIPFVKCGANVRVRLEDFEAWLAERTISRRERAS